MRFNSTSEHPASIFGLDSIPGDIFTKGLILVLNLSLKS